MSMSPSPSGCSSGSILWSGGQSPELGQSQVSGQAGPETERLKTKQTQGNLLSTVSLGHRN